MSRLALLLLIAVVAGLGLPSSSFAEKLVRCVNDEASITYNFDNRRESGFEHMKELGATCLRVNMYPDLALVGGNEDEAYKTVVMARSQKYNFCVNMTLTGSKQNWEVKEFADFVRRRVKQYRDLVCRWSVYNEPNLPAWLHPSPGLSLAETYYRLWRVAYRIIKGTPKRPGLDPGAKVMFGELAAGPHHPLKFLYNVLCPPSRRKWHRPCRTIEMDALPIHIYTYKADPAKPTKKGTIGYSSLDEVYTFLKRQRRKGRLMTPERRVVPIHISETGWFRKGRSSAPKKEVRSERLRAKWQVWAYNRACKARGVREMTQYMLFSLHKRGSKIKAPFDTSIIGYEGQPDFVYQAMLLWKSHHPECLKN